MSFLQPANAASLHKSRERHGAVAKPQQRSLRKAQSNASFLSPLVDLARHPTRPLEEAWGVFRGTEQLKSVREIMENNEKDEKDEKDDERQILYLHLKEADKFDEWQKAACELDVLEGNETWKKETWSAEYDVSLVQARLKQLNEAKISCDIKRMLFLIRTSLTRGLGGMGDLRLYKHSHIGTKVLIERYIESAQETLQTLLDLSDKQTTMEPRYILDQLLETRQAFGRSALLLSGGGTFGMNHSGVVKALWEAKLLPRIISGSSAGSIVCAVLCTKTDDEIPAVLDDFCYGDLAVFEQEGEEEGFLQKAARFMKFGSIFDISHLIRVMRNMLGDLTFQEAYNRTRRILNISVSSESVHELPRLLNYITAPNVVIWSAVAASCSVPLVFSAAQILAKDTRTGDLVDWNPSPQKWIDGSVDSDLPMTRLAEMFNVNHFIVSQVNPHVVPFLSRDEDVEPPAEIKPKNSVAAGPGWLHTMADLARGEALHRMHVLAECGVFPNYLTKAQSILSQKYSGDITILPEIPYAHFTKILRNPTTDFMLQAMLSGERATWPKLSRVQNHCAIELALDQAISMLRSRIVFSPSQVDLRLNTISAHRQTRRSILAGSQEAMQSNRTLHRPTSSLESNQSPIKRPRSLVDGHSYKHSPSRSAPQPSVTFKSPVFQAVGSEFLSSSAEDDPMDTHLFTDGTEDTADSYSSEDDGGPKPELWPSTRQLFPSASQPTTPFFSSRLANSQTSLSMTPRLVVPSVTSLTTKEPSSPELRYKQLFHGAPESRPSTAGTYDSQAEAGAVEHDMAHLPEVRGRRGSATSEVDKLHLRRASQRSPLKFDISGTRGMLLRMKRSMSTGVKGLRPPEQR
jgi:TAG lipase/steryl ester hydrolase/phospholipase A2/LPA acyltransferase